MGRGGSWAQGGSEGWPPCCGLPRTEGSRVGVRGRHAIGDPEAEARLAHKIPPFCPGSCLRAWIAVAEVNWCLLEVLGEWMLGTNPFEDGALPRATAMAVVADGVSRASCSPCNNGTCSYHRDFRSTL